MRGKTEAGIKKVGSKKGVRKGGRERGQGRRYKGSVRSSVADPVHFFSGSGSGSGSYLILRYVFDV